MGWAQSVHPESISSSNRGDWVSHCVWRRFRLVVCRSTGVSPTLVGTMFLLTLEQKQGWGGGGRLGVNTLMNSWLCCSISSRLLFR